MKRLLTIAKSIVLVAILVLAACQSGGQPVDQEAAIDRVMDAWMTGLIQEEIDLMMSSYCDDAVMVFLGPDGEEVTEGADAIRANQQANMDNADMSIMEIARTGDDNPGDQFTRVYEVGVPGQFRIFNSFAYVQDDAGRWLISEQQIEFAPME